MTSRSKRHYRTLGLSTNEYGKHAVEQFPKLVGLTLHDAVYKREPKEVLHIGTQDGRAFFFVGNRKEFNKDIDQLGELHHTDFRLRPVVSAYSKIVPDEGAIIIVEGSERGGCWDLEEYRANKRIEERKSK